MLKPRALIGPVMLLACLLAWMGCQGPRQSLDLAGRFSETGRGPLLGPSGELGEPRAAAFLTGQWEWSREQSERKLLLRGGFRFFAQEKVDVRLLLEGRAKAPCQVSLLLNGRPLRTVSLSKEWGKLELDLVAGDLRVGQNNLYLESRVPTRWRRFEVSPGGLGRSAAAGAPNLGAYAQLEQPATVSIPFATTVAYPLNLPEGSRLVIAGLEPWVEPGAAALADNWSLQVLLRSDEPPFAKEWNLSGKGPHRLDLPTGGGTGAVSLSLGPRHAGEAPPLPGQLGLTMVSPAIELAGSGPTAGPSRAETSTGTPNPLASADPTSSSKPPNVILYLVDTLRADHLGCYGYQRDTSPNFDQLAAEGVLFEDMTAESSWTKPSTATLLTGLPSLTHGVLDFADMLPPERETLAELFAARGYATAAFLTNPLASPLFQFDQGFQTVAYRRLVDSDKLTGEVVSWLDKQSSKQPFFLYVHTLDPHLPYNPPADLVQRWSPSMKTFGNDELAKLARESQFSEGPDGKGPPPQGLSDVITLYDGEVAANDRSFGQLVSALRQRGLYENTLIAVVSDHGEELFERQGFGHVHTLYQELIRVPQILKLPGGQGAGTTVKSNWRHPDTAPTLLSLAGLAVPKGMTGRPFSLTGAEDPPPPSLSYVHTGTGAVVTSQAEHAYLLEADAVRMGRFQLITTAAQLLNKLEPIELYDLQADPGQKKNLAYQLPTTTLHLARLARRLKEKEGEGRPSQVPQAPGDQVQESLRGLEYLR